MMKHITARKVQRVTDEELNGIVEKENLLPGGRTGQTVKDDERVIVFNNFAWRAEQEMADLRKRYPRLNTHMLLGQGEWGLRDRKVLRERNHGVCQTAYELHCAHGCLHGCAYCHIRKLLTIMLNLEEYIERLDDFIKTAPWLNLFKYDNQTDQICFEPEYGASDLMTRYFARQPDKYLLLYTKSDNVDHLLDLPHGGHTIINWSMSCDTVSRTVERNTPDVWKRIEAAEKCQKAGYIVRARFSPIVPIITWREEYGETIREYLARVKPDVVTLDILGWMDAKMMEGCFDVETFDPEFREYARGVISEGNAKRDKPYYPAGKQFFSHELRSKIYRFFIDEIRKCRPDQRISICMETPEMWQDYGPELGMSPENYVCCCGPTSVPGNPLL
ncbi:MAG: spore photoproduct lyase family protein [Planctomycetota bacterium]